MKIPFLRRKRYHCIHCWRGYDKKQLCSHCGTPTYSADDIMRAAIEHLKEGENEVSKVS